MKTPLLVRRALGAATLVLWGLAGVCGLAREAAAQDVLDLPIPGIGPPPLTGDIEQVEKRAFWRAGKQRWFFAASGEAGNLYLRATGALGYGKPHWSWVGLEEWSSVSPAGGAAYAGLRVSTPYLDVRAGSRYTFTMSQHFLAPRPLFTRAATEENDGPKCRYATLEAEAATGFALLRGSLFGIVGIYGVVDAPKGWAFFEQALQIVIEPPIVWRARLGYLQPIDRWDSFRLGATVEAVGNPTRGAVVVRAGPAITAQITHHLEAFGAALVVLTSPDDIGILGDQLGEIGFRYRWATGDRWPEFP